MKKIFIMLTIATVILAGFNQCMQYKEDKYKYLGQPLPGSIPEIFAPNLVSTTENDEYGFTISADGNKFYFTRTLVNPRKDFIYFSKHTSAGWSKPKKVDFINDNKAAEPVTSPDGKLFLFGKRVENKELSTISPQIWFINKTEGSKWNKPKYLLDGIYASIDKKNNIYFTDLSDGFQMSKIAKTRFENNAIQEIEPLPTALNSHYQNAHPFISPDGDFIIFDSFRPEGYGSSDLYISFKIGETWSIPKNMGENINTENYEAIPYLSPDGKYLYFSRVKDQGDIYWIDARIIEELKSDIKKNF